VACAADDCGLDDALLADCEVGAGQAWAELGDYAAELVAEDYGNGVVSAGVRRCGCDGGTVGVFVEVGATDAYVRGGDLCLLVTFNVSTNVAYGACMRRNRMDAIP
jgi:hypothetical protein